MTEIVVLCVDDQKTREQGAGPGFKPEFVSPINFASDMLRDLTYQGRGVEGGWTEEGGKGS